MIYIQQFTGHFHYYDWLCHLATLLKMMVQKGGQVTKPIIDVKMPCKLLYICHSSKRILNKMFNFLALLDIRVFGRL